MTSKELMHFSANQVQAINDETETTLNVGKSFFTGPVGLGLVRNACIDGFEALVGPNGRGITFSPYMETLTTATGYVIDLANTPDKSGRDRCKVHVPAWGKSRSVAQVVVAALLELRGVKMQPGYEIHHINGVHEDNDPRNLCIVTPAAHKRLHYAMDAVARGLHDVEWYLDMVYEVRVRF